jgi:hypothetical protein
MQNQTESVESQVRNNLMAYAIACAEAGGTRNQIVINVTLTAAQLQINKAIPEVKEVAKIKIEDFTTPIPAPLTTSDKIDIALAKPRVESEPEV